MATLLDSKWVRQIAFGWGGTIRVFECDGLVVYGQEDSENWIRSSGKREHLLLGVWLDFDISFRYVRRISPSASAGNDLIDVINAINDPTVDVAFFPIYDIDNTVSHVVIPRQDKVQVVNVERFKNIPSYTMRLASENRLDDYPAWTKNTRLK